MDEDLLEIFRIDLSNLETTKTEKICKALKDCGYTPVHVRDNTVLFCMTWEQFCDD
jgi:Zn-finger protein